MSDMVGPGVRLGIVRSISYGLFGRPDQFVPSSASWAGRWCACTSTGRRSSPSPAGTPSRPSTRSSTSSTAPRRSGSPSAPAHGGRPGRRPTSCRPRRPRTPPPTAGSWDRLVRHCDGRVRYWQCDNEPSNVGLTWAGTAAEYVAQLQVLHRAVKDADPGAAVVLGGAPYALAASPPGSPERQFFDVLLRDGRDLFDLFDLHLYGDASRIPADIETTREMMRAFGYEKPLVVGEYNAPWPNLYPEATAAMEQVMAAAFAGAAAGQGGDPAPQRTPEEAAMASLYEQMAGLPPQLQMFMRGVPAGAGRQAAPYQPPRARHAQPAGRVVGGPADRVLEPCPGHPRLREPLVDHGPAVRQARADGL